MFLNESYEFNSLSIDEKNIIYNIFKSSYEKSLGTSWTKEKFFNRAKNWLFFGDMNGFICIRPQKSGFYKLVGVGGDLKSILKGLNELNSLNKPIWGMVDDIVEIFKKNPEISYMINKEMDLIKKMSLDQIKEISLENPNFYAIMKIMMEHNIDNKFSEKEKQIMIDKLPQMEKVFKM